MCDFHDRLLPAGEYLEVFINQIGALDYWAIRKLQKKLDLRREEIELKSVGQLKQWFELHCKLFDRTPLMLAADLLEQVEGGRHVDC